MKKFTHGIMDAGSRYEHRGVNFHGREHSRIPAEWGMQDYRVLQYHGVTLVSIDETSATVEEPKEETFVSMHGAYIEQPERLAESLTRTLGRRGRK